MNHSIVVAPLLAAVLSVVTGCGNGCGSIPFHDGENYFVRGDVADLPQFICSPAERDSVLGMATTMWDGPTRIDFEKEVAIPVALPATNSSTDIHIVRVEAEADSLVVTCRVEVGDSMSYSIRPLAIAIVGKDDVAGARGVRVVME